MGKKHDHPATAPHQQPHVVTVQPTSGTQIIAASLPNKSTNWTCPTCHRRVNTKVDYATTTKTHVIAILMCTCCCWLCAWLPYTTNSCRAANHSCPECNSFIGVSQN